MQKRNGDNTLSDENALAQFDALDLEAKTTFVNRHFNSELVASGRDFEIAKIMREVRLQLPACSQRSTMAISYCLTVKYRQTAVAVLIC